MSRNKTVEGALVAGSLGAGLFIGLPLASISGHNIGTAIGYELGVGVEKSTPAIPGTESHDMVRLETKSENGLAIGGAIEVSYAEANAWESAAITGIPAIAIEGLAIMGLSSAKRRREES